MMRIIVCIITLTLGFNTIVCGTSISFEKTGVSVVQKRLVNEIKKYLGAPYVWADTGTKGFDCSGLIFRVYSDITQIPLPRQVESLKLKGNTIKGDLLPADLVFFDTEGNGKATHVGLYIGEQKFIHAASAGRKKGVITSSLEESYYKKRYLGAKRYINEGFPLIKIDISEKKPTRADYPGELIPGIPVYIIIYNSMQKTRFINLYSYRDKKEIMVKRIRLSDKGKPALISFIPDNGSWSLLVQEKSGDKLAMITL